MKALYVDFDFEEAQKKLAEAEEVLHGDFFLVATADAFVDAARHLISESYCKIHQRIDIRYGPFFFCCTWFRFFLKPHAFREI